MIELISLTLSEVIDVFILVSIIAVAIAAITVLIMYYIDVYKGRSIEGSFIDSFLGDYRFRVIIVMYVMVVILFIIKSI
jgi:hypothetical protein